MIKTFFEMQKENYDRLNSKLNSLLFIDGIAVYYDSLQESNKRYALVTENGKFLLERVKGYGSVFVESIKLTEYGLFEMPLSFGTYYIDKDSNCQKKEEFEVFKKILFNRTNKYYPDQFFAPDKELIESRFQVCKGPGYGWHEKEGTKLLEYGTQPNGLTYMINRRNQVGKDNDLEFEEVVDCENNKMYLSDYWQCFVMVANGKRYLEKVREFVLLNSTKV